jgi:hypothetical protein
MRNHFHLVVETPQPNLVAGMKWFLGTYTSRYNRRHREFGHLFSGRYKALIVDGSGNGYLKTVCDYVHLNPARARLLKPGQSLQEFKWSSYPLFLAGQARRPPWLRADRLLGEWRIPKDSPAGRRVFAEGMERRRREDTQKEFKAVERGWCLGDEQFRQELLDQVHQPPGTSLFGEAVQEGVEARAERLIQQGLKKLRWSEEELEVRAKGEAGKVRLAMELRCRTTMSMAWIAQRLRMGTRGYAAWLLQQGKRNQPRESPTQNRLAI